MALHMPLSRSLEVVEHSCTHLILYEIPHHIHILLPPKLWGKTFQSNFFPASIFFIIFSTSALVIPNSHSSYCCNPVAHFIPHIQLTFRVLFQFHKQFVLSVEHPVIYILLVRFFHGFSPYPKCFLSSPNFSIIVLTRLSSSSLFATRTTFLAPVLPSHTFHRRTCFYSLVTTIINFSFQ